MKGPNETLPYSWYSDPDVLRREQERIFRRRWQYVGHAGRVPEPGCLAPARAGDVPVLLVRDRDGDLRAYLNVCRHRGARLVAEDTQRATIQCPYHAWTYELDGRLRSAPRSQLESDFEPEELGLVSLSVDRWGPFVFVNPDADAAPLADTLGELPELVASAGVDVDALRFRERWRSGYAANWKICVENFLECYHCQVAHPGFTAVVDVSEAAYRLEEAEWYSSQFGALSEDRSGDFDPAGSVRHAQFHLLYPNLTINIAPGAPNLSIGPVMPDGPERTDRFLDYFFAPDAEESWIESFMVWDGQVGEEDRALVEGVHQGVRSGMLDHGVLFRSERLIRHWNRLVRADLGEVGDSRDPPGYVTRPDSQSRDEAGPWRRMRSK